MRLWFALALCGMFVESSLGYITIDVNLSINNRHVNHTIPHSFDIDLSSIIDATFDDFIEETGPVVERKTIILRAIHPKMNETSLWAFNTIVMVPSFSCVLMERVVDVFDGALKHANPKFNGLVKSTRRRIDSSVCQSGVCPCTETKVEDFTRVLEIETISDTDQLFLPLCDEFPFEYDSRSDVPLPFKKRNYRGRVLFG
jgi:hypothetical protein